MNVIDIADQLYNEKPKPACTVRISVVDGNSINEQFEIISLLIFEGLERKIATNPTFDTCKDEKKFIKQISILLKLYLASIGVRMNIEILTKKDIKKIKLTRSPNFWEIKKYKFNLTCLYKYIKKGKEHTLYYNPKSKLDSINDGFLIVKIRSHCFKIIFKHY